MISFVVGRFDWYTSCEHKQTGSVRIYCMSGESSLAEYQACAGPKIGDVAPWLVSLCDCCSSPCSDPRALPEWGHSQKGNIHHHLEKKNRWYYLTYTGRSGKYWKWQQRKVTDVAYEANYISRACWKKQVHCLWVNQRWWGLMRVTDHVVFSLTAVSDSESDP